MASNREKEMKWGGGESYGCDPHPTYLEVNPIQVNGDYFQAHVVGAMMK